ncbi:hypothetical protein WDW86_00990 [Bdellovibrionota bacterium FG-2]
MKTRTFAYSLALVVLSFWGSACANKPAPIVSKEAGYTQISQSLPGGGKRHVVVFAEEGRIDSERSATKLRGIDFT